MFPAVRLAGSRTRWAAFPAVQDTFAGRPGSLGAAVKVHLVACLTFAVSAMPPPAGGTEIRLARNETTAGRGVLATCAVAWVAVPAATSPAASPAASSAEVAIRRHRREGFVTGGY